MSSTTEPPRRRSSRLTEVSGFFAGEVAPAESSRRLSRADEMELQHAATLDFSVQVESLRFAAYMAFYFMVAFAIAVTRLHTKNLLLDGPEVEGSTCPPFQTGTGFDIDTDSHLHRTFNFNNICVNWDYTPSRELTAMVYPLFEYTLLLYVCFDFLDSWISYKKGYVSAAFFRTHCVFFPCMVILCAWFRMIFVVLAYENVQGHTAGFLGMQVALIMVAIYNSAYALEMGVIYKPLKTLTRTRRVIWTYLSCNIFVSGVKIGLSAYVVITGSYPEWAKEEVGGMAVGEIVDMFWMIFNAVLPSIISFVQAKTETPLLIKVDQMQPIFVTMAEAENLHNNSEETKTLISMTKP